MTQRPTNREIRLLELLNDGKVSTCRWTRRLYNPSELRSNLSQSCKDGKEFDVLSGVA